MTDRKVTDLLAVWMQLNVDRMILLNGFRPRYCLQ